MADQNNLSESQILNIFEILGLDNPNEVGPAQPNEQPKSSRSPRPIYVSRLSDSSMPPPTGVIKDAKLENTTK